MPWSTTDVADVYSHLSAGWDTKSSQLTVVEGCSNRLRLILPEIVSSESRVLDFGCGTGKVYSDMVRLGLKPKALTMVDASAGMCEVASSKTNLRLPANVIHGDENSDELRRHSPFDVITMLQVLHHIPEPVVTLSKLRSLASKHAHFLALVPGPCYKSDIFPFDSTQEIDPVGRIPMGKLEHLFEKAGWEPVSIFDDRFVTRHKSPEAFRDFVERIGLMSKLSEYAAPIPLSGHQVLLRDHTPANIRCQHITVLCKPRLGDA